MPEFVYEALTNEGRIEQGRRAAASEAALEEALRERGTYLIKAELYAPVSAQLTDGRINPQELLAFTEYLAGAVQVGLPLVQVLSDVELRLRSRRIKTIVREISSSITEHGKTLSEALAEHPKAFPSLYVGTVAAGEASGHMDYALQQLVDYLDWQMDINTQVKQAMMYPAMVMLGIGLLTVGLVGVVYPRLLPVLARNDVELPLPTVIVMAGALFLRTHWLVLAVGGLVLIAGLWLFSRTEPGKWFVHKLLLRLPVFGAFIREINMARLVTYLALFYRTGVEVVLGLTLIQDIVGNRVVAKAVQRARERVIQGETLSRAFGDNELFPTVVVRAIALGESTGKLDESLARVKAYYAREIPAAVKRMTTALQPLMVILLGVIITVVALSIILPILSIYQSIGTQR
ncbi:MAG: type II secretion system F family protein [Gemmatimonadota bacterium]